MAKMMGKTPRSSRVKDDDLMAIDRGNQLLASLTKKKPEEVVMSEGVPQWVYLGYIKRELDNENACLELPLTIVMLVSFLVLALYLLNQSQIFSVEEGVYRDIEENANFAWAHNFGHKTIHDVNSVADFWSWFRLGYLPLVVAPTWVYSENYPASLGAPVFSGTNYGKPSGDSYWNFSGYQRPTPHRNDYLRYNRVVGGIKLRQWVAEPNRNLCRIPTTLDHETLLAWLGKPCMPSSLGLMTPELMDVESFGGSVRRQFLLPEIESLDDIKRTLVDMEDGCHHAAYQGGNLANCRCDWCKEQVPIQPWVDEQTERVEIAFIMFNPVYGMYTYVGTNFIFNRGGHIHKRINVMSVWADPRNIPFGEAYPTYISGAVWVASLLYVVIGELREMRATCRNSHERFYKALWEDYVAMWNMVDWFSITLGMVVVYLWVRMRGFIDLANAQFIPMVAASAATVTGSAMTRAEYMETAEAFFATIENSVLAEKVFRIILAVYPNMLMLRLFKSFAAQPRLAVVTATLTRATPDLVHFFIVFLSVYLCMVVNSVLLFGQDMQDFSTIPRAVVRCFRTMFGSWDWDALRDIGYLKAQIWFWGFMLIMVLILLNMLLAIFMDAYTAVKQKAANAATLMEQIIELRRRRNMFTRGERVRLNDIWDVFAAEYNNDMKVMLSDKRPITVDFLMANVPRLQFTQAKRTLTNSLISEQKLNQGDVEEEKEMEDVREKVDSLRNRTQYIIKDLSYAVERTRYYDRCQASGDLEYEFHFGGEGQSSTQQTQEAVSQAVTEVTDDICDLFEDNLRHIEDRQGAFERQQNELHGLIAEMQMMVRQQAWAVTAIQEATSRLGVMDDPPLQESDTAG